MLEANQSPGWGRSRVALAAALSIAAVLLMFGIRASAAQACTASSFCAYTGENFNGGETDWGCLGSVGQYTIFGTEYKSAINHCGGQSYEIGWSEGGGTNWKACLSPAEQRATPGRWNEFLRVASC
jgi:hypothetical protein